MGETSAPGVQENTTRFIHGDLSGLGRFRRFGEHGPLYEITEVRDDQARIRVVLSGEETDYPVASALCDPLG